MKHKTLCTILAAMLLTGCTGEPLNSTPTETNDTPVTSGTADASEPAQTTALSGTVTAPQLTAVPLNSDPTITLPDASASETAVTTTAVTSAVTSAADDDAGGNVQFVVIPAPAETYVYTTTKPVVTTAAKPDYNLRFSVPVYLGGLFFYEDSADLAGTGYVHAKDGLRLRDKPSTKGKQLATIKDGSTVEILGVAAPQDLGEMTDTDPTTFGQNRWFRIKADGKEGYANADYIAAKFTQKPAEMTKRQLRVLASFLYYQGQNLFMLFAREGGFKGRGQNTADSFSNDQGLYEQVQPASLSLSDIYSEFYQYFSEKYNKDILMPKEADKQHYYAEKDGKLYTCSTFGDIATWLNFDTAASIDNISETEIKASAYWHYNAGYGPEEGFDNVTYTLVYEDGVWKIGTFKSIY